MKFLKLGDKPLADMTEVELREAISTLRAEREELRKEAISRKREKDAGAVVPKESRVKKEKVAVSSPTMDMLAFLRSDKDEI